MKQLRNIAISFFTVMIGFIFLHHSAIAGETRVSGDELKSLLSGNTVEGNYIKWKTTHKMFFDASGEIRRTDSRNNDEKGNWRIYKDDLCVEVRKERCNQVMKREDGGYNVMRRGEVKFTFEKILPGNPHNL